MISSQSGYGILGYAQLGAGRVAATSVNSYSKYFTVTIDHTKVANSDQTDFPMLFSAILPDLKLLANGGNVRNSNGYDIAFAEDSAGASILSWEIEKYDPATGQIIAWVKIPTLSYTTDTVIYLCYSNFALVSDISNPADVWSNGYGLVLHLGDGTTISTTESSANTTVTAHGTVNAETGIVGGGATVPGTNGNYLSAANCAAITPTDAITLEAWMRPDALAAWQHAIAKGYLDDGSWNNPYLSYALSLDATGGKVELWIAGSSSSYAQCIPFNNVACINGYRHYVGTFDGDNLNLYVDGANVKTEALNASITYSGTGDIGIGTRCPASDAEQWNGGLDEVRISSVARSADWIETEYNNMRDPLSFYTVSNGMSMHKKSRTITIDHTKCSASDSTNFPMLFGGQYDWLAMPAFGGDVARRDGFDIFFTSDAAGQTLLKFERAIYSPDGKCEFYVKIPTLSHTTDTIIYIWYGDPSVTTDQSDKEDTWDSNFWAVYHLTEFGKAYLNSKSGYIELVDLANYMEPVSATGLLGGGNIGQGLITYDGGIQTSSILGSGIPIATGPITVEAIFKRMDLTSDCYIVGYGDNSGNGKRIGLYSTSATIYVPECSSNALSVSLAADDDIHHLAAAIPAGGNISDGTAYLDGSPLSTSRIGSDGYNNSGVQIRIGGIPGYDGGLFMRGFVDECRISNVARSADWILATHNNLNNTSSFYSIGDEVMFSDFNANILDSLLPISDSLSVELARVINATIYDSIVPPIDAIYPPPEAFRNYEGNVADVLPIISDALSIFINRAFTANVSDTLLPPEDSIAAAGINLETPVRWVAPIKIIPRTATLNPIYLAAHPVRHPELYFEPRVKSYGTFTRAISAPAAFVKTGDVNISLVDSDNSIRQRISAKTIRKASAEVRLGPEDGSYSAFLRPCKREVGTVTQSGDGVLNVPMRDFVYDFFEQQIPPEIDTDRYPNLPESPARDFAPIIIGVVSATDGAIPLFLVDTVNHGYMVARHICKSVDAVYRKRAGEDEFSLVGAGEYTVSNLEDFANNRFYCIVNFTSDQADAEIRANVTGYYDSSTLALKCTNFSDFILEIFQTVLGVDGGDKVNFGSFETVKTQTAADGLACAGVLSEKMTFGECLSQLQRSSNIDIFTDKNDRITVHYTTDDEEPTVHLDDLLRLYKGTISQSLADPAYNQIPYKYSYNPATGKWTEDTWNNEGDQEKLGEVVPEEPLQLYWVRDAATALAVVERRAQYLDLDSFRFEADIPLIPVLEELELADLVTIEHFGGIKVGGYLAEQFKVLELSMDIDNLKYKIKGIRRRLPPPTLIETEFDDDSGGGDGGTTVGSGINGVLAINCRPGPYYNNVEGELFAIWRDRPNAGTLKAWVTDDFGAAWHTVDIANQPNLANNITSYDCCASDGLIHVATQESNGRLAYHVFNMASRTWTTVDQQILASANTNNPCVSIEKRNPDGEVVIYFQGARVLYSGTLWERGYYAMLSGGSWTAPVQVTPEPQDTDASGGLPWYWLPNASASRHCFINRVAPGRENRMHFFYQYDEMMMFKPPEMARSMQGDRSFTARVYLQGVGWLYWPASRNVGGSHIAPIDNYTKLAIVRRRDWGNGAIHTIAEGSSLSMITASQWDPLPISFSMQTHNPCGYVAEIDGILHSVISVGYQISYNISDDHGASWGSWIKASPAAGDTWWRYPTTECNGDVIKIRGKKYLAYFSDMFRWISVDELPYSPS